MTALVAAGITVTMLVVYVVVMNEQGDTPLVWVLAVLGVAAALAVYSANPAAAFGPAALSAAAFLLIVMGVLGLFSIGLPLLVAGVMAAVSAWRQSRL